jgi:hypothetical protein
VPVWMEITSKRAQWRVGALLMSSARPSRSGPIARRRAPGEPGR